MPNGSVVDHFDRRSDRYDSVPSWVHDEASLKAAVSAVAASYAVPPAKVLDLGAGSGALGRALMSGLRPSPLLTSLDVSAKMLARGSAGAAVVADAHQLPFMDYAFDLVVTRQAFHYLDRPDHVLAGVRRVLPDGGCLLASQIVPFEAAEDIWYWQRAMTIRQPVRRRLWTAPDLKSAMSTAGFSIEVETETVTRGSLRSWLDRYDVEPEDAKRLHDHFKAWMRADNGLRAFRGEANDITYALRWITLVGRCTKR